jgi:RimJ/RimL family protein N-acetyltransferase
MIRSRPVSHLRRRGARPQTANPGDAGYPLLESCGSIFYDGAMAIDVPVLSGARLVLRRPRAEDVEARFRLGTHREIVEGYGGTFDPAAVFTRNNAQSQLSFIEKHEYAWIIDVNGFIGHVRFFALDPRDRRAALAIGIEDPAFLGKGYGSEAIRLALSYIFSTGLHRISVRVLAGNERAIACYRKCGFQVEGREREAALVGGRWQDDIIMGVLAGEFVRASR